LYVLQLPEATSALEAVKSSPLLDDYPDAVIDQLGIFSRPVAVNTPLRDGDRVEVYRPLKVDPKERRRQVAADN
jgi:putative ubiquitin-RnfH superfamily antitoxin RatB of RatAB toxin-antitoxin module